MAFTLTPAPSPIKGEGNGAHLNAGSLGVKEKGFLLGREALGPAAGIHQGPRRAAP